jgi:hypothetical protein
MKYRPMLTNLKLTRFQCIINRLNANNTQQMGHRAEGCGDQQFNEDAKQMSPNMLNTAAKFIYTVGHS